MNQRKERLMQNLQRLVRMNSADKTLQGSRIQPVRLAMEQE